MDIKQLSYFVQIAADESFSAAARKLFVSQPALSKAMKSLEQELSIKLFYSADRKTKLTEAGERFYKKAQKLLEDYRDLIETAAENIGGERGHITLGLPPIVGSCLLTNLVARFYSQYPQIEFTLVEKGVNALQEDVMAGAIDMACVILPLYSNQFDEQPLTSDKNVLLVSESHPLADCTSVDFSELANETFVLFNEEFTLYRQILTACRESGFEPNIAVTSSQWDFLTELVRENQGISILPRPILQKYGTQGLKLININHRCSDWNVSLISKKGHYMTSACRKFMDYLKSSFNDRQ